MFSKGIAAGLMTAVLCALPGRAQGLPEPTPANSFYILTIWDALSNGKTTDADVRFDAAVVSQGPMALGARCDVAGPVVGESQVMLGRAVEVGTLDALTTVTAQEITLSEAVCIHGSVWARESGRVRRA